MRKALQTTLFLSALILIGAGCGSAPAEQNSTSTDQVIMKAPSSVIARERAALYAPTRSELVCERAGYSVVTRFDSASDSSLQYCHFVNGTECPLAAFVSGTCTSETGVLPKSSGSHVDPIVSIHCTDTDPPVCGVNGHTYENNCLAVQTSVTVAHEGRCTEAEIEAGAPPGPDTERKVTQPSRASRVVTRVRDVVSGEDDTPNVPPPATNDPEVATQGNAPAWLATSISLIESSPATSPRMYIEHCNRSGYIYYLETNGTGEVASTAYTENGNTICYPNRDFSNSCPDAVIARGSCSRTYTDSR